MVIAKPITVKFKALRSDVCVPEKATDDAACYDLVLPEDIVLPPQQVTKVGLGFAMELPKGYHAKLFLRSSTGKNTRLRLGNGTGIIDADYRGEVCALIDNTSGLFARAFKGDRLVQMMIDKNIAVSFVPTEDLEETKRGAGGFGSTGK